MNLGNSGLFNVTISEPIITSLDHIEFIEI